MAGIFFGASMAEVVSDARDEARARAAQQAAGNIQKSDLVELRDQVERLTLLNQALWELIRARLNVTDAELEQLAQEIDLRDGKQDGKLTSHPLKCPNCGRVSNSRHRKCLYCGLLFETDLFA